MGEYACPNCKKPIYDEDALLCHFCGGSLRRASKGLIGRIRYVRPKAVWFILMFIVLLGYIFLFVR